MASIPIGGVRVDLTLNSAAFIKDIAKTNAAIGGGTKKMVEQFGRLQAAAKAATIRFAEWATLRAPHLIINFLNQAIDLAGKLGGKLAETVRAFRAQGEAMKTSFQLGLAEGFLESMKTGGAEATNQLKRLAEAGLVAGKVLKIGFTVIVDVFTILIPEAINLSLRAINKAIEGLNKLLEWGQKFDNLFGLGKDYGQVPLIDIANVQSAGAAFFDLSEAENLAAKAASAAAGGQEKLGKAVKATTDDIAKQTAKTAELQRKQFEHAIQTTHQWLDVAGTVGAALDTMFRENKAVAIAQAVINTAQAITEALKLPFPINWAQVAAVTALGAAQIATIVSAQPGSSKAMKKSRGAGGGGDSATARAGSASRGGSFSQAVTIHIVGDVFGPEHFRKIAAGLNDVQRDGTALLRIA